MCSMKVREGILERMISSNAVEILEYLEDYLDNELEINPNNNKAIELKNKIYCRPTQFIEMDFEELMNEFIYAGIKINFKPLRQIISYDVYAIND